MPEWDDRIPDAKNIFNALCYVGNQIKKLGLNGADTKLGGMELISKEIKDGCDKIINSMPPQ